MTLSALLGENYVLPTLLLFRTTAMATRNPSLNIVPSLKKKTAVTAEAEDELKGPRGDWWWTGVKPTACPGFDEQAGVLR